MIHPDYDIEDFGEYSLLVKVKGDPSNILLAWLLSKKKIISDKFNVEVIHTYNELLIKDILPSNDTSIKDQICLLLETSRVDLLDQSIIHKIPVCYDPKYALDIRSYSKSLALSIEEVIRLHTSVTYTIYFMGFLPGFPYLEGLDRKLHLDRKSTPSRVIKAGSVAIGGAQTGMYPQSSPGGWHCIGRTPLQLFSSDSESHTPFKAGDRLEFYSIALSEYEVLNQYID